MKLTFRSLNQADWDVYRANVAFLTGRMEEIPTVEWALKLNQSDTLPKLAIVEIINDIRRNPINEPWLSAWRLIEEMWNDPIPVGLETLEVHYVIERLSKGERSKSLASAISSLVRPRIKVETNTTLKLLGKKLPRVPRKVTDLVSTQLASCHTEDVSRIEIQAITELKFLCMLAHELNAAVDHGLDLVEQIGWNRKPQFWNLGGLHRVYYVYRGSAAGRDGDPDRFHEGIAPSVKMLHAVVSRLSEIDIKVAREFVLQWKLRDSPVHLRLWAAMARNTDMASSQEVSEVLLDVDNIGFWDTNEFPELAELRSLRFKDLDKKDQNLIIRRIKRLPPMKMWSWEKDSERIKMFRLYLACREMRRIEDAGGVLEKTIKEWLELHSKVFPELTGNVALDRDFLEAPQAGWISPNPDKKYDMLSGLERIKALEAALSTKQSSFESDPAGGARDWINDTSNAEKLLTDFESIQVFDELYSKVWNEFMSVLSARSHQQQNDMSTEAQNMRILDIISNLNDVILKSSIEGITQWMSANRTILKNYSNLPHIWLRLWPFAVSETNCLAETYEGEPLNKFVNSTSETLDDLDAWNSAVGRLTQVFLARCPTLHEIENPFEADQSLMAMRTALSASNGYAALISKYLLTQELPYLCRADSKWARDYLIRPLLVEGPEAIPLWRALARSSISKQVSAIIGPQMVERATDSNLGREARKSLVFRLVVDCMFAIYDDRTRPVPEASIQQMIRALDDEVRAHAVTSIKQFITNAPRAYEKDGKSVTSEQILENSVRPFMQHVWPQELSLVSPGISEEFADLPSMVMNKFAESVALVERFLVPFKCWSLHAYGFFPNRDGSPDIESIDRPEMAKALLKLLDLTIGTNEDAVIPMGLSQALQRIQEISPTLADTQPFRRLGAASRRV